MESVSMYYYTNVVPKGKLTLVVPITVVTMGIKGISGL